MKIYEIKFNFLLQFSQQLLFSSSQIIYYFDKINDFEFEDQKSDKGCTITRKNNPKAAYTLKYVDDLRLEELFNLK